MKKHYNFYAVAKGRCSGIYSSWSECLTQVDGYKHNSFKGFNTLTEAVNFMVTAGISVQEINMVETEGEVIMKRSLISIKPNILEELSKIDTKTEIKSSLQGETQQDEGIQCISIDGSCRKNGTENAVAGFGIFWGENHPNNISEDLPDTDLQTNQTAELTAAVRAVQQVTEQGIERVCIQTDSAYVHKGITCWINNWMVNGWKTAQGVEVKHRGLWESLYDQCQKVDVVWKHMKGHAGDPGNEAADKLSKMATDRQKEASTRNTVEKVSTNKKSTLPDEMAEKRHTSLPNKDQAERQCEHTVNEQQDALREEQYVNEAIKSTDTRNGSSSSVLTQTYPSKLEIHQEELLKAFKSMETQVLKIVEHSYTDQNDAEKNGLQKENLLLKDKVKGLEEMLKNEKKEKERLQREVKHQEGNKEADGQREKELEEYDRKRQALESEVHGLKQERERNLAEIKSQQEKGASLRKMLESVRKDIQYSNERLEIFQKESVRLQEKYAQLQEKEEKQHEEIKELKRQICIRDDLIQNKDKGMGFIEVSHCSTRKNNFKAPSHSGETAEKDITQTSSGANVTGRNQQSKNLQSETGPGMDVTGCNQQRKEPEEVITVDYEERREICKTDRASENAGKNMNSDEHIRINADVLLIGTSIIKDIDTQRMSNDMIIKKHVLQPKTVEGALKFISHLDGNINTFLLQIGSNDLEQNSSISVYQGIEKVVKLIGSKFPESKVLVSGLLPRWKINAREGMIFKNKKSEVNEKLSSLSGITYCAQDNFNRQMFYDGTHLNPQGTAQLVSNYKYWIGKATGSTRINGNNAYWRQREMRNALSTPHNKSTFNRMESQRDSYANRVRGQQPNASRLMTAANQPRRGSDDKLFSLVKLLKDIMNSV